MKIRKLLLPILILIITLFAVVGCAPKLKSYEGTEVAKITYSTVDYFGGITEDYLLDFTVGTASKRGYMPHDNIPEYKKFADFTESAATTFFDKCYTYGLFSLKKSYTTEDQICDGGGWSLTIEYVDGTTFSSMGDNAGPDDVFAECAFAFYELCRDGVVGYIPSDYIYPPDISISFQQNLYLQTLLGKRRLCGIYF